ncbi:MAG TPA: aminoacyl-tRNA hydrolase [Terriglobales bacterium]
MKLIVGLGNPGPEYEFTPHNVGFLAIEILADQLGVEVRNRQCRALTARVEIGTEPVVLAKPETYMNLSGQAVRCLLESLEIMPEANLIVIQDELDFPLGTLRIQRARSSAGHNGIESILDSLGTNDFLRIRIGVAPEHKPRDGKEYLLAPMRKPQLKAIESALIDAAEAVKMIVTEGPAVAMQKFNRKPEESSGQ